MRIFALETNIENVKKRFITAGETEIFTVHRHIIYFLKTIFVDVLFSVLLGGMAYFSYKFGVTAAFQVVLIALAVWGFIAFFSLLRAFIDWQYDFTTLTTDRLIVVNQSSVFRQEVTPINLQNINNITSRTQWLNLFGFGIIQIVLNEGVQTDIVLTYIPDAEDLVAKISQQMTIDDREPQNSH